MSTYSHATSTFSRIIPEPSTFYSDDEYAGSSFFPDDDDLDDTLSLTSSVFDYVYENGRRYCSNRFGNNTTCLLPNDTAECERLELTDHCWSLLLDGELKTVELSIDDDWNGGEQMQITEDGEEALGVKGGDAKSVVSEGSGQKSFIGSGSSGKGDFRVLDLGTGTGTWAIQFGDAYPTSTVYGIDISPIQTIWVPPNVKFEVDNFEDDECWEGRRPFHFIHARNLVGSVRKWDVLLQNIYKGLAPGGVVEFKESDVTGAYSEDGTLPEDSAILEYNRLLAEAGRKLGQRFDVVGEIKDHMQAAGFVDIKVQKYKLPIGRWPRDARMKEIGMVAQEVLQTGVEAYAMACLTRVLGWELEKAQTFFEKVVRDVNNRRYHTIYTMHIVHGRKPEESEL